MSNSRRWPALGLPLAILLVLSALAISTQARAQAADNHPAHIHEGTCDNLGDIVVPLDNVALAEASQLSGAEGAIPVEVSDTEVDLSLDDILAGQHAINIHESAENIQEYIACGEIGGPVRGDTLVIGLAPLNNSGKSGVAVLEGGDDGGTEVTVYLIDIGDAGAGGAADAAADDTAADDAATEEATAEPATEEATEEPAADDAAATEEATAEPAADDAAADDAAPAGQEVVVDIANFAYNPSPIEINVGDTITWTNQDGVPHTVTGQDRAVLQSGTIAPGASFSQTFDTAGEISYFCEFHPNMNGLIIVN